MKVSLLRLSFLLLLVATVTFSGVYGAENEEGDEEMATSSDDDSDEDDEDSPFPPLDDRPPKKQPESWQDDLVSWLGKKGGYYSPKVQWQKTPELGNSYNMYAVEEIPKGETIMIIPQAALITSNDTGDECVTIANMIEEYDKGTASDYYPYINYLFGGHEGGTSTGLLPTTWSKEGQELLTKIVGKDLFPRKFQKGNVFDVCDHFWDEDEDLEEMTIEVQQRHQDAYIFWLSRSWSDKMVPILDMINHRNGKWLNVESTTAHSEDDIRVYAKRNIQKGEQLHNTYNECLDEDCQYGAIMYDYVTQHILMDYGFVEALPRRWLFHVDYHGSPMYDEQFLVVEIDQNVNDTSKLTLDWHFITPTDAQIEWMTEQLERLRQLDPVIEQGVSKLTSSHEKYTIAEYHRAYKEALQLALDHKDDEVSTKTVRFDENDGDEDDYEPEL